MLRFIAFRVIGASGIMFVPEALFSGLATGQAEVSYKFWAASQIIVLAIIVVARLEKRSKSSKRI